MYSCGDNTKSNEKLHLKNQSRHIDSLHNNSSILKSNISFIDSIILLRAEDSIIFKSPIRFDTSYFETDLCGNVPRCKKYVREKGNVVIEICQLIWPINNEENVSIDKDSELNFIKNEKSKYAHKTEHKNISNRNVITLTGNWNLSGITILSKFENNSIKINCTNINQMITDGTVTPNFEMYSIVSITCNKSSITEEEITEWAVTICSNIEL